MSLALAFLFGLAVAQTTKTPDITSSRADECPFGWVDADDLGCFLFMTEEAGVSWGEALELCEFKVCTVFLL